MDSLRDWLIRLGYQASQIQVWPQYRIRKSVHWQKPHYPVDLAVFRGEERRDEDLILIAECKSEVGSRLAPLGSKGMDQLRRYLECSGCPLGIWYDGSSMAIVVHALDAMSDALTKPPADFAQSIRERRERLDLDSLHTYDFKKGLKRSRFSVREVAKKAGIQPTYLSKIERKEVGPPSEGVIRSLAAVLEMDVNSLLVSAGRIPEDLQRILMARPDIASQLLSAMKENPQQAISDLVVRKRTVRDGKW